MESKLSCSCTYSWLFRVLRTQDFETFAVRSLMGTVEIADYWIALNSRLIKRSIWCLTFKLST